VADPGGASKVDAHALALTAQAWVTWFARVQTRETNALAAGQAARRARPRSCENPRTGHRLTRRRSGGRAGA